MRVKSTVRLGMLFAATVAAGAFAVAIPASAAVISHPSPAITGAPAGASILALRKATVPLATSAAQLDAATHPDTKAAPDGPYPIAYDERTIPLTGTPNEYMPEACVSSPYPGTIYLTAGEYEWDMFIGSKYPQTHDGDIWLESATYTWADCLVPQNGYYWQYSVLCPLDGVHPCVETDAYPWITSGTYTFGSWLDWLHP